MVFIDSGWGSRSQEPGKGVRLLQVDDVSRLLGSARTAGALLLVVPVVVGVALNLFPNYDARAEYLATFRSVVPHAGWPFASSEATQLDMRMQEGRKMPTACRAVEGWGLSLSRS